MTGTELLRMINDEFDYLKEHLLYIKECTNEEDTNMLDIILIKQKMQFRNLDLKKSMQDEVKYECEIAKSINEDVATVLINLIEYRYSEITRLI